MKYDANVPHAAGTYAVVNLRTRKAYVGVVNDLYACAHKLDHQFEAHTKEGAPPPLRAFTGVPNDELQMIWSTQVSTLEMRDMLAKAKIETMNSRSRTRLENYTARGRTGSLQELCLHFGVGYRTAYRRLAAGMPIDQIMGAK